MSQYSAATIPSAVWGGDIKTVWNAETPTPGTGAAAASSQVALGVSTSRQRGFFAHGKFSGAPGAFEVDIQAATVDADANYQTVAGGVISAVDATNNTFGFDGSEIAATFVRLLMRARTNAVSITATIAGA